MDNGFAVDKITIGTRGSPLALWQANWIKGQLEELHQATTVELKVIKTSGDKIQDVPLAKAGGKGLFTKEIEESILKYGSDIAIHSMKDVPIKLPAGLVISVVTKREDPHDALISKNGIKLADLPQGAKIGTGSFRRTTQLLNYRPDLDVVPMRGNLETRLKKLETEGLDAIILAAAGLKRLGMADKITEIIPSEIMLPGGGQGAVGIESRSEDMSIMSMIFALDDEDTHTAVDAERSFLTRLKGGCQVPIGVYATIQGETIHLRGLVGSLDGKTLLKAEKTGPTEDPQLLGDDLALEILKMGADKILAEVYDS